MRPEWGYWRVLCCLVCCALSGLVAWSSCVVWLLGLVVCCVKPLSPSPYLPVPVPLNPATIPPPAATPPPPLASIDRHSLLTTAYPHSLLTTAYPHSLLVTAY